MKTYWEINESNGKNYYANISNEQVEIWEDTGKNRYTEAGTVAGFKEFLESDFYQNLLEGNMGKTILQEVIASIHEIQNKIV